MVHGSWLMLMVMMHGPYGHGDDAWPMVTMQGECLAHGDDAWPMFATARQPLFWTHAVLTADVRRKSVQTTV